MAFAVHDDHTMTSGSEFKYLRGQPKYFDKLYHLVNNESGQQYCKAKEK